MQGSRPGAGYAPRAVAAAALGMSCAAVLAAAAGCGGRAPEDPAKAVVATVGDRAVTRGQLDAYMAAALGSPEEAASADVMVKSRLLDQLLDEELLLEAAAQEGLSISEDEARQAAPEGQGPGEDLKRSLLQRKLKAEVILGGVSVAEEDIRTYYDQHKSELQRPAHVVFRQILLDAKGDAEAVRRLLDREPSRFEEIAAERSLAPDGGRPQAIEEAILPDALRAAMTKLSPGEISPVVDDPQGWFIVRLEERQPEQAPSLEEARKTIELRLLQERGQARYQEFVTSLRQKTDVKLTQAALGFAYVKRHGS